MKITFDRELDAAEKGIVSELSQKKAALEGLLVEVQTERAGKQVEWTQKEQAIKTELSKIEVDLRAIRAPNVV